NPFAPSSTANLQVLCVNPAAPGGGAAPLDPYYPTRGLSRLVGPGADRGAASTAWVAYPGQYTGECRSTDGATWLQATPAGGTTDPRPLVGNDLGPAWGLHTVDVNIALGNLVELVRREAAAYRTR